MIERKVNTLHVLKMSYFEKARLVNVVRLHEKPIHKYIPPCMLQEIVKKHTWLCFFSTELGTALCVPLLCNSFPFIDLNYAFIDKAKC